MGSGSGRATVFQGPPAVKSPDGACTDGVISIISTRSAANSPHTSIPPGLALGRYSRAAWVILTGFPLPTPTVSEPYPTGRNPAPTPDRRSLLERLVEFISPGPDSRDELIASLADAEQRNLIEPDARRMVEGVLRLSEKTAGDVMVAEPRMDVLDIDAPFEQLLETVIRTAHSRFPVVEGGRDNIIGMLMSKDLIKLQRAPELNLRALLRPAVFVPESKALTELLREFRSNRNHMAIVIDEFGQTAGLITIEDVLEEIVGEIEDEFDIADGHSAVYTLADGSCRVAGDGSIEEVNEAFGTQLPADDFETIGGLVAHEMGRVPRRGESAEIGGLRFVVMLARGGAVRWFRVTRVDASAEPRPSAPN